MIVEGVIRRYRDGWSVKQAESLESSLVERGRGLNVGAELPVVRQGHE